ncbi:MAG: repressor LexA [Verrucomicrobia bacterium]|nr:repressor LexA [Verrucomicrobiota bacterium]
MVLTERQRAVLSYLEQRQRQSGVMPSTRELQQHFGFSSQTAAVNHLRALERKGAIKRQAGKARAVRLTAKPTRGGGNGSGAPGSNTRSVMDIPVFGEIPAGMSSPVDQEKDGCVSMDLQSAGINTHGRTFALRVRGDSMTGAHILDGDLVILENRPARRGDIVAALIDGETTLKRYTTEAGRPILKAENPSFPNLQPTRELAIQGVMIGLVRPV